MDKDGVLGAIREVTPAIRNCYDAALKENDQLSGRLVVSFDMEEVDGVGKVVATRIEEDSLADGPTAECVQLAMGALQFDAPAEAGTNTVTFPFTFRPG